MFQIQMCMCSPIMGRWKYDLRLRLSCHCEGIFTYSSLRPCSSSLAFLSSDLRTAVFQSDCRLVGVIAAPLFFSFAVILLEIRCSAVTWSSYSQALLSVSQSWHLTLEYFGIQEFTVCSMRCPGPKSSSSLHHRADGWCLCWCARFVVCSDLHLLCRPLNV